MNQYKGFLPFILTLIAGIIVLIIFDSTRYRQISWHQTYDGRDKIPYGTYILERLKKDIFASSEHLSLDQDFYSYFRGRAFDGQYSSSSYVCIDQTYQADRFSIDRLLQYVSEGHTALISAETFPEELADTLGFKVQYSSRFFIEESAGYNYVNPALAFDSLVDLPRFYDIPHVASYDSLHTKVLGYYQLDQADYLINYISTDFGKGKFLIHTTPKIFTNYHILKAYGDESMYAAFSYLPQEDLIIWDDYNRRARNMVGSPLRFIFSRPSLTNAYYLLIFGLLLYVLFFAKRKQRPIPLIPPLKNSTLDFIRTISMLYYHKSNHAALAHKKVEHFQEYIASTYHVNPNKLTTKDLEYISKKSGVGSQRVHFLFKHLEQIKNQDAVESDQLILLNGYIENFHEKSLL